MKKFIFMLIAMLSMVMGTVNAQTAVESQKIFDNVYVGVNAGAMTPLTFNSVFPVNAQAGIRVGKDFTPVFGAMVEGTAVFGDNLNPCAGIKTFVKAVNVGINGTVNFSNLIGGYKGAPRTFEVITVTGLGYGHTYDVNSDLLTAKTAVDLAFNLGKTKAYQLYIEPGVNWYLGAQTGKVQFNKNYGQVALMVGFNYKFNTSNGTHNFKTYDIAALNKEINDLRAQNADLMSRPAVTKIVEKVVTKVDTVETVKTTPESTFAVTFKQGSAELSDAAKAILDQIPAGKTVDITGCTSPEGSVRTNTKLAAARAKAAADYLTSKGVTVKEFGKADAGRAAVVTIK